MLDYLLMFHDHDVKRCDAFVALSTLNSWFAIINRWSFVKQFQQSFFLDRLVFRSFMFIFQNSSHQLNGGYFYKSNTYKIFLFF